VRVVAFLAGALIAVTVAVSAASGARESPEAPRGTFRVALPAGSLLAVDPALDSGGGPIVLRPVCASLMSYPDEAFPAGRTLTPELAESEPVISKDGRTYTFTLRKDARFSDGTPVTARAFARSIERALDPKMDSTFSFLGPLIVGGEDVLAGRASTPAGVSTQGRTLTLRLTRRVSDLPQQLNGLCAVAPNLPADPEGAKAPLASPAPYYVAEYTPGQSLVLAANRFYRGHRAQHLSRIIVDLDGDETSMLDDTKRGTLDWGLMTAAVISGKSAELARIYGINKRQFWVKPASFFRMFVLNTSRPLFRDVRIRQAVNLAVDRTALTRELGPLSATPTDQYLRYRNERIYPLAGPDLRRARALANGKLRNRTAVLYTSTSPVDVAQTQILRANLAKLGLHLEVHQFPGRLVFEEMSNGQNDFDIGRIGFGNVTGPVEPSVLGLFDGRSIGTPANQDYSYFNSPKFNRRLDRAAALPLTETYKAYSDLDVWLSRNAAPAIPYAVSNSITFVSARTGCVVLNPFIDLTAVCIT